MSNHNLTGLDCKVRACAEFESKILRFKREWGGPLKEVGMSLVWIFQNLLFWGGSYVIVSIFYYSNFTFLCRCHSFNPFFCGLLSFLLSYVAVSRPCCFSECLYPKRASLSLKWHSSLDFYFSPSLLPPSFTFLTPRTFVFSFAGHLLGSPPPRSKQTNLRKTAFRDFRYFGYV